MTARWDEQRTARAALTYLAEPGDPALAALLADADAARVVAAIRAGRLPTGLPPAEVSGPTSRAQRGQLERAVARWSSRLVDVPHELDWCRLQRAGIRLVCPGDFEWPTQLDVLGDARPCALWLLGNVDLRHCCLLSVSIVGSRAATAYGAHVCAELAAGLAQRGWTIVSGAAYGIDGCAHRSALAADGVTVAVLGCGVDYAYPRGHEGLLTAIAAQGLLVSEWPPGRRPSRRNFLTRNRVIAALTRGTVVVEAGTRSGALNTAAHARDTHRPLMAVPGPVTSDLSAGCHKIIREWGGVCVTGPRDVLEMVSPLGEPAPVTPPADDVAAPPIGPEPKPCAAEPATPGVPGAPVVPAADLDQVTAAVLAALPLRRGAGPATIAASTHLDVDAVLRSLGLLAAGGFIERCARGWRIRRC